MARILIVDDDLDMRSILGVVLESSGHESVYATGGWDALERLDDIAPDLVLLDITLGDIEGMAVLRRIRGNPKHHALPVIVVSGHNTLATRAEAEVAGASSFIAKPFVRQDLIELIDEALRVRHG